jgi:hypothetical protein
VTLAPWDYLFTSFRHIDFPDIFRPIVIASIVLLIVQVIVYNVRTRQLHRFEPLANLQEWLLWTGLIMSFMLLVEAIFEWYFIFVVITLAIGLACYVWIRFFRFPPIIAAYNQRLRRARFFSQEKYKHPEATIRSSRAKRARRRRR